MGSVKGTGSRLERVRGALRKAAFEELYSNFAWAYDWVSRTFFMGQWRVWQRSALHYVRGRRVLEVGMGTGDLQLDLFRAGHKPLGIDFSPQMIRQAARKLRRAGVPAGICRASAAALPFPSGSFDTVLSTFPSEYIIGPRTQAEIARVLRPGGRLVIVPGGWLHPRGTRSRLLEWVSEVVYGDRSGGTGIEEAAVRAREKVESSQWVSTLSRVMSEAGFEVTRKVLSNKSGSALIILGDKPGAGDLERAISP